MGVKKNENRGLRPGYVEGLNGYFLSAILRILTIPGGGGSGFRNPFLLDGTISERIALLVSAPLGYLPCAGLKPGATLRRVACYAPGVAPVLFSPILAA